ncbi:MAG: hypothetical protein KC434_06035, partial [Anaerolineales bacterium]|nr:hypothetical protein [Anaerolineales bacterium]
MSGVAKKRSEIPHQYQWDVESIFATPEAWETAVAQLQEQLKEIASFKGRLSEGPAVLADYFAAADEMMTAVGKVFVYASLSYSVDTNDQAAAARNDRARGMFGMAMAANAFAQPEMLAIGFDTLRKWLTQDERLADYGHYLDRLEQQQAHVRSAEVEQVLGLVREIVKSNLFGASDLLAAYTVAALVPNTLFNLITGGEMVSSSLVPVFSDLASKERRAELWSVVSSFLSLATAVLLFIVALVMVFTPQIAWLAGARNFSDSSLTAVTEEMMRLATPAVLFLSVASILTGVLYALERFTLPAFTAAVFNGTIVIVALLRPDHIDSLIYGLLLGSFLQIILQLPALRDGRFRVQFNWRHPAVRRILILYAPIVVGLLVNQVAIWISYNLAILTGDNSVTYMNYATTLYQFPLGLVVTALSMATLPTLSQIVSAYHASKESDAVAASARVQEFKQTLASGLRLVL